MKPTSTLRDLIFYPQPTSALSSADSKATRTEDESSNVPLRAPRCVQDTIRMPKCFFSCSRKMKVRTV